MMHAQQKQQTGFTLVEMIVVMVITGIIGGMVAMFIRAPVQGYADSSRRAEMGDIADTALRRLGRDIRTAVPNSIRVGTCGGTPTCVEFLPTSDGGRYRAAAAGSVLVFGPGGTLAFDILGPAINFTAGDRIVIGSTQSDGMPPYNTTAAGIMRTYTGAAGSQTTVTFTAPTFPSWAQVLGQRFDVVPVGQLAVTYACVGVGVLGGEGTGTLVRYWNYGVHAAQQPPAGIAANASPVTAHAQAILADRLEGCEITYNPVNQRNGLLTIWLQITRGGESVRLYHAIHVNNLP